MQETNIATQSQLQELPFLLCSSAVLTIAPHLQTSFVGTLAKAGQALELSTLLQ